MALAIFQAKLGQFHPRSLTTARNILKCHKGYFDNVPAYKNLWVTYVEDPFPKEKKAKKGKKKK